MTADSYRSMKKNMQKYKGTEKKNIYKMIKYIYKIDFFFNHSQSFLMVYLKQR